VPNGEHTNRSRACFSTHRSTSLPGGRVRNHQESSEHPRAHCARPSLHLRLSFAIRAGQSYPVPLPWVALSFLTLTNHSCYLLPSISTVIASQSRRPFPSRTARLPSLIHIGQPWSMFLLLCLLCKSLRLSHRNAGRDMRHFVPRNSLSFSGPGIRSESVLLAARATLVPPCFVDNELLLSKVLQATSRTHRVRHRHSKSP
jgi:hypothetical protein